MIVDRALGQSIPAGAFDATFYRATHDGPASNDNGLDTGFATVFPTIKGVRGAYHYAHPAASSATEQANRFIRVVTATGFKVGTDLWMLDAEKYADLTGPALAAWIDDFMEIVSAALGDRGFLYMGFPYFEANISKGDFTLLRKYRWWLPAYGKNDGTDHGVTPGLPVTPVLHQYTSVPYDRSNIVDFTRWHDLFDPGVVMHPQFNPAIKVVSVTEFLHPKLGVAFAAVQADGSVFTVPSNAYLGGMNGSPDFKGRSATHIVDARTTKPAKRGNSGYVIYDVQGEAYGPDKLPHAPTS